MLLVSSLFGAELPSIIGTLGLTPVENGSAIAIWVPVSPGKTVSGVTWYNNDGATVFPEFLAIAGEYGAPGNLSDALSVGTDVEGETSAWSEIHFLQQITSSSSGLYLIMRLLPGSDYESEGLGGGSGVGYFKGGSVNNCWVTGDGVSWSAFKPDIQVAVFPLYSTDKSGSCLVLDSPRDEFGTEAVLVNEDAGLKCEMNVFPNPFNAHTVVKFSLAEESNVSVKVFDLRGQLVATLAQGSLASGDHHYRWDGRDDTGRSVSSGTYFFRMIAGGQTFSSRTMLVK